MIWKTKLSLDFSPNFFEFQKSSIIRIVLSNKYSNFCDNFFKIFNERLNFTEENHNS